MTLVLFVIVIFAVAALIKSYSYNKEAFNAVPGPRLHQLYNDKYGSDAQHQIESECSWFAGSTFIGTIALMLSNFGFDTDWLLPLALKKRPENFHPVGYSSAK